jgi:hypothetical protein
VLYLGKAWDNYAESVAGYSFFLESSAGRFGWEGTAFLDALTADQLANAEAVAVYGVRWRERANGEAALLAYLERGGSVVIDASGNLGELPYDLADTVVFDTVIRREALPERATIQLSPAFAARHPGLDPIQASPFIDETGGEWFGAAYEALPGSAGLTVLATVDGRPLVATRTVGAGRVYWIAYNFMWHAFITENAAERALIAAVFDEAIAASTTGGTR